MTTSIFDVAQFILREQGEMSALKLQKLCYYAQSLHSATYGEPLFAEKFEAWANGPACSELHEGRRGRYMLSSDTLAEGDVCALSPNQVASVLKTLSLYAGYTPTELSQLSYQGQAWLEKRVGFGPIDISYQVIDLATMVNDVRHLVS